ncbi:benzoate 4-monooxygenase cytochrome P450 [Aspergillus eucalypticola CBS 122712]|uniref:Benzoate 4-monooxygenase cytochrome P450 n=1 Tax=Aspergillus eucalypticola (strain CBS 122712 / IBT 29274) TaxID=1448314 RepID=A0A317W3E4_ASPEC|nr:benzoate 4-monooxygenase cytochrome P450 [Aspergillus eucalypticola CBS 122712]PWY80091.1 benzoate 4-monooxygenase cytochrome P450 [Aspergillus eucalypticola CBS 122712]
MLAVVVGFTFIVSWIVASFHRNHNSSLKDIPNAHFSAPYSRLWLLSLRWRNLENRTRIHLHRRLGPVIRIGPRDVSVNCIDDGVRTIYSSKFDKDESFYHELFDQVGYMVTMTGNDEHRERKRMLSRPYSNSYILNSQTLGSVLSRISSHLKEKMTEWASSSTSVDVYQQAKCCTLDVASGWLFGSENATDTLRDPGFENDLTTLASAASKIVAVRTTLYWPFAYLASLIGNRLPNPDATVRWQAWLTRAITDAYRRHPTKPSSTASLYDSFYDAFKTANPKMPRNEMASYIAVECDDHLSASHLGLGTLLAYTMYELSRHPDCQRALRKELLSLAEPSDQSLAHRLADLPVLDAVVTETMRTRAPCPGPFPRVVPDSGCRLAGKFDVPGGTIVSSSAWALHFNPFTFPSPEEWHPGRWLEADGDTVAEMRKWVWTFGSGARVCIGTHFSMRVIKELLATVYTDYETYLDDEFTGNVEQVDAFSAGPIAGCLQLKFRQLT